MLINFLAASVISSIIFKAIAALGIGMVYYVGFDFVLDQISEQLAVVTGGFGEFAGILGLMGFDEFISFVISAYSTVFTFAIFKRVSFLG